MNEFVVFVPGINTTRTEKQFGKTGIVYYDQASFERDYENDKDAVIEKIEKTFNNEFSLDKGDVVISNSMQVATIVGKSNAGKVPSLNFTKVKFINNDMDKQYFVYLFNSYVDVKRQKERDLQGNGLIRRLSIQSLNQIVVPVVPIETQKKIGEIYIQTLKIKGELNHYAQLLEMLTGSILEKNLKEK